MLRWRIALLVSAAIAISYLDRQTLPVAIKAIQGDIPISNQVKAFLDSAFLLTYGLMYLGGGKLIDRIGTRWGFALTMIFWSLACASHGLAGGVVMLASSRLLLGIGEGGGIPAATRAVVEWFPVRDRSTAMGIINGGTAVGGIVAPPLIAVILRHVHWLDLAGWRWVFFITGTFGFLWIVWWLCVYFPSVETEDIAAATPSSPSPTNHISIAQLLHHRETWGVVIAKFLSDSAWYFYLFWLPKYLYDARGFDIKAVGSVAWIPHAAAGVGCLCGGTFSSYLLVKQVPVNQARKWALGASAVMMPLLVFVPHVPIFWAIVLFCIGYFGQQSWSTIVMVLPTDLFPRRVIGTVAGMVGMGGAMGGLLFGQLAGYLLDHGFGYGPVFAIAGSFHVAAFAVILVLVPRIQPLDLAGKVIPETVIEETEGVA